MGGTGRSFGHIAQRPDYLNAPEQSGRRRASVPSTKLIVFGRRMCPDCDNQN
jgi:hypothetical protein